MKGNPTAGILLLLLASLFIVLGTRYKDNVRGAWDAIRGVTSAAPSAQPGIDKLNATGTTITFKNGGTTFVGNSKDSYYDNDLKKWVPNPNYKP